MPRSRPVPCPSSRHGRAALTTLLTLVAACAPQEAPNATKGAPPPRRPEPPAAQQLDSLPRVDHASLIAAVEARPAAVTVVAAWATWCQPCITELVELARYYEAHEIEGLSVIGLCLDDPGRMGRQVQQVLDRVRVPYEMVVARPGEAEALMRTLAPAWTGTLPASILFGPGARPLAFIPERLTAAALAEHVTPRLRAERTP